MSEELVTQAKYRDTGVRRYVGNPLIEALPTIWSPDDMDQLLGWNPELPQEDDRQKPAYLRVHEVPAIRRLIYLIPEYRLYQSIISVLLRDGYTSRNPMNVRTWQYLHLLNDGGAISDLKPIEPIDHQAFGILFSGVSGAGKTTFIHRLFANYPRAIQHTQFAGKPFRHLQIVWIKINCPHNGSLRSLVREFFVEVDKLAGTNFVKDYFPKNRNPSLITLLGEMQRIAANYFLGVLIIDELQNLNRAKSQGDENMLEFLGNLIENIGVPVIYIGTPAVTKLFKKELRVARRTAARGYYEFHRPGPEDPAWIDFLETLWKYQWIDCPVKLTPSLRHRFYEHSQGITALAIALFILAQYRCLLEGQTFDEALLDDVAQFEMAAVQSALRALRSNSEEAQKEFDDLLPTASWLDNMLEPATALKRAHDLTNTPVNKTENSRKLKQTKKGASIPSHDPKDLRNLPAESRAAHEALRDQGITPMNPLKLAGSE